MLHAKSDASQGTFFVASSHRHHNLGSIMHKEQAYVETAPKDVIQFKYAESLQI